MSTLRIRMLLGMIGLLTAAQLFAGEMPYLRWPDLQGDKILFTADDDLWMANADGSSATRLTTHPGQERNGVFSEDGTMIAFTAERFGNGDVYVMPATGGEPKRLTYHNSTNEVVGWTPDGKILFRADRLPPYRTPELYAVSPEGGYPEKLPYLRASHIAWEPGGSRVALVRNNLAWTEWNRYRGGEADKIWVGDPSVPEFALASNHNGNESWPMWHPNGRIYFVADIVGRENLWSMMPDGSDLRQETQLEAFDVRYPRMSGDWIIFQNGADLATFNVASGEVKVIEMQLPSSLPTASRRFLDPNDWVDSWRLNETGDRMVVETRGELYTLPIKGEGLIRRWTRSSGSREQSPAFLPDGSLIAITDASGEHQVVTFASANAEPKPVLKETPVEWEDLIVPSPDGNLIALATGDQKLWLIDQKKGTRSLIDQGGWEFTEMVWSPTGRYLAFVHVEGEAEQQILYIHDTKTGENHAVSEAFVNTSSPSWDPDGKYLYAVREQNFAFDQDYNRSLFLFNGTSELVLYRLRNTVPSPFAMQGDVPTDGLPEPGWLGEDVERKEGDPVTIEFEGFADRLEPLPQSAGSYGGLYAVEGKVYFFDYENHALMLFDLADGEASTVLEGASSYEVSGDGSTVAARKGSNWYWGSAGGSSISTDGDHTVNTSGWTMEIQPREEWRQILREAWRQQREFFYDSAHHGVDWKSVLDRYSPLLDRVHTRDDLNDLIREIQAEQSTGHSFIARGDEPELGSTETGMLAADLAPDPASGYYRIERVIAPLPGVEDGASPLFRADPTIGRGTYILAIDGRQVRASENILHLLEGKAGVPTSILINDKPSAKGAREVIIEPMESDRWMRMDDWAYQKRDYVIEKSNGKVGYFFLPDMSSRGMWRWGRDYYPQRHLPGLIVDDRYNSGGNVSELFLKEMAAPIHTLQASRYGAYQTKPHGSYFGHPVFLINGVTFSDGEMLAHAVNTTGYGTSMGTRTSGGGVWLWARRPLVDNGFIVVPEFGNWSAVTGEWVIEATGVSPQIEVVNDPASELRGEDKQLDAAIELLLKQIADDPRKLPDRPTVNPIH